jgi:hypothetical protein
MWGKGKYEGLGLRGTACSLRETEVTCVVGGVSGPHRQWAVCVE